VKDPEYRSWLRQELAFFNRSRSKIRSGYFWLEQEPEQEWFLAECFKDLYTYSQSTEIVTQKQEQWRSNEQRGGASGGTCPIAQALGTHQHTFCSHLKMRFKQKFWSNFAEKCVFKKETKNRLSIKGFAPEPSFTSGGWGQSPHTPVLLLPSAIYNLVGFVWKQYKCVYYRTLKKNKISTVNVLLCFFRTYF